MDESRFDSLTRALVDLQSRRGLVRLLAGLSLAIPLPPLWSAETTAKGK